MKKVILLIGALAIFSHLQAQKQRVWVDTDIMIGKLKHDVDDGLALIMLLADTAIQIEGISFVHGVNYAQKVTEKMLGWYAPDRDIPLFKGADRASELGTATPAVEAIIVALEKGPMTILALGPMTNVATALQFRPDLHSNVLSVVYCAGRVPGMTFSPGSGKIKFSDYNFDLDPVSSELVLNSGVPMLLAGYDCSDSLFIAHEDFIHLKQNQRPGDKWLYHQLKEWEKLWRLFMGSEKGFIPFDCSTVGAFLYPNEFEIDGPIPAFIKVDKNDSKNTVSTANKPYLLVKDGAEGRPVSYCSYTKNQFKERLLRVMGSPISK